MDAFEAIKATFFQECDELLADLEAKLMLLEQGQTDLETINAVFRAVHSVKGGAGAFGLEALVRFAHVFETLVDELRAGRKPCDAITIKTLLRASDVLADHIQAAQGLIPPVDEARSAALVAEMQVLTHGGEAPVEVEEDEDDFGFTPMAFDMALDEPAPLPIADLGADLGADRGADAPSVGWRIVFKPMGRMYVNANETSLLLRELGRLGPVTVVVDESETPTLDALSIDDGCLTWTVDLAAAVDEAAVREVFDFVESDCDLTITPLGAGGDERRAGPLAVVLGLNPAGAADDARDAHLIEGAVEERAAGVAEDGRGGCVRPHVPGGGRALPAQWRAVLVQRR